MSILSVVHPDPVGSETFSWIRNYLFRIRFQAKMKKNQNFTSFFVGIVHKIQWNAPLKGRAVG